ncbi:MAG: ABC transporter permease [Oscillospiraceae bacterium]|jgi:peptide/nickel transport system permease protein|nr:ABC transporter permease [Oscillospiraceae bacterium]
MLPINEANTKANNDINREAAPDPPEQSQRLDDEARVKVLSPSMLVFKRFVRNRLAVVGAIILITMFLFSFVGGVISPYSQSQTFYKNEVMWKEYANLAVNNELRYAEADGASFPASARAQFILALNGGKATFAVGGVNYTWSRRGEDLYSIYATNEIATALSLAGEYAYTIKPGADFPAELQAAFESAQALNQDAFDWNGAMYTAARAGKSLSISSAREIALATMRVFDAYEPEFERTIAAYDFRRAVEFALAEGADTLSYEGINYSIGRAGDVDIVYDLSSGTPVEFAIVSPYIVQMASPDVRLTVEFKDAILDALRAKQSLFTSRDADGAEREYQIALSMPNQYTIKRETVAQMYDTEARPSWSHWLGTDSNGMDMLTRLMYGGRISLMVGFVVVLIELFIGVIIGGVSGYFGGAIDLLLMRFIDLFNCIPQWPILIIMGSVMDTLEIDPYVRIFLLMLSLGLLGWTGIARVVRGQILTLREQDFMIAAEATGIRVSARIFRHLVPNVMPLLIVQATLSLGGVIITEATLSFLGMGLKYPLASWGTIINAATNIYTMTNFWYLWIPAGMLILITVLGFNFVGDGLRDAFDPKMKR